MSDRTVITKTFTNDKTIHASDYVMIFEFPNTTEGGDVETLWIFRQIGFAINVE